MSMSLSSFDARRLLRAVDANADHEINAVDRATITKPVDGAAGGVLSEGEGDAFQAATHDAAPPVVPNPLAIANAVPRLVAAPTRTEARGHLVANLQRLQQPSAETFAEWKRGVIRVLERKIDVLEARQAKEEDGGKRQEASRQVSALRNEILALAWRKR